MKFSFPTVMTLITVLVSASAESTFVSGGSLKHEDGTNFNHRALRGDAEVMVKEEETFVSTPSHDISDAEGIVKEEESKVRTPTRQLADCYYEDFVRCPIGDSSACGLADGYECTAIVGECDDDCCSHTYHLGPMGLDQYCGLDPSCWGKDTLCVPGVSCTKCCNSWSWYLTGPYCD